MKKFLSLLSIFAIIAMLFTSCEGGGGGEGEEGELKAEGVYLYPNEQKNAKGNTYYMGFYLNGGKKYMCYTNNKQAVIHDTTTTNVGSYTVDEKNVRIDRETFILGYNKLTDKNGTVTLTKITPTKNEGKSKTECDTEIASW